MLSPTLFSSRGVSTTMEEAIAPVSVRTCVWVEFVNRRSAGEEGEEDGRQTRGGKGQRMRGIEGCELCDLNVA